MLSHQQCSRVDELALEGSGAGWTRPACETADRQAHAADPANQGITVGLIDLYIRVGQKDRALALAREESGAADKKSVPLIAARARADR